MASQEGARGLLALLPPVLRVRRTSVDEASRRHPCSREGDAAGKERANSAGKVKEVAIVELGTCELVRRRMEKSDGGGYETEEGEARRREQNNDSRKENEDGGGRREEGGGRREEGGGLEVPRDLADVSTIIV
eukprot:768699-Hanusia_phi.AAC.6